MFAVGGEVINLAISMPKNPAINSTLFITGIPFGLSSLKSQPACMSFDKRRESGYLSAGLITAALTGLLANSWPLMSAITLEACHAADVLEQAFKRYGPDTVNTDQGSQFNAKAFVDAVKDQGCLLSMDGLGAWRDNLFVERLWRSVKYERICLHTYDSAGQARASILDYFECYNHERPHSSLKRKAPHIRRITMGYQPSSWPPKP